MNTQKLLGQLEDDIAALATPLGVSALAVIRLSGPLCLEKLARLFSTPKKILQSKGYTLAYGFFLDRHKEPLDQITLAIYKAPKSYTGQDCAEIFCHGSPLLVENLLKHLFEQGFRQAQRGEFTLRAVLNKKFDLTQAEAVHQLIHAQSLQSQRLALSHLKGDIFNYIQDIKQELLKMVALVNIQLDYAEDDLEPSPFPQANLEAQHKRIQTLLKTYATGQAYKHGFRIVLAGPVNAGKSSLFNLLLKEDRSIVSPQKGTTRDYIQSSLILGDFSLELFDTAGMRETQNVVEQEGIERSHQVIAQADLILYVIDGTVGLSDGDHDFLQKFKEYPLDVPPPMAITDTHGRGHLNKTSRKIPLFLLLNKQDSPQFSSQKILSSWNQKFLIFELSAKSLEGFSKLLKSIQDFLQSLQVKKYDAPILDSLRQKELLEKADQSLGLVKQGLKSGIPLDMLAVDLMVATEALGEITGEVNIDLVLQTMFSQFCVGK